MKMRITLGCGEADWDSRKNIKAEERAQRKVRQSRNVIMEPSLFDAFEQCRRRSDTRFICFFIIASKWKLKWRLRTFSIVEIFVVHLVLFYSFTFRVLHSLLIFESVGSNSYFISKALSVACCAWSKCTSINDLRFTQQSLAAVMRDHSKNVP